MMSFSRSRFPAALAVALSIAAGTHAELGGRLSGTSPDGASAGARVAAVAKSGYVRHDLTRANGGSVREFENAKGQVFAVTWSGPGKPDLRVLMGRYFSTMQAQGRGVGAARHSLRRPLQVNQSDLQIQTGGHMGWFNGVAFGPSLAPSGFSPSDLAEAQ